jgi:hypothetical protein
MVAALLAGTCLAAEPPKAARQRTLPAIHLSDSNGVAVSVDELGLTGHWLLVYVQAKNPSTPMVMGQLKSDQFRDYAGRLVIVVGSMKAEDLAAWTKQFPELSGARWLADPEHAAMRGLDLHGFPVQLGMKDNGVEWQLNGAGQGNEMFEATMLNWLKHSN